SWEGSPVDHLPGNRPQLQAKAFNRALEGGRPISKARARRLQQLLPPRIPRIPPFQPKSPVSDVALTRTGTRNNLKYPRKPKLQSQHEFHISRRPPSSQ